VDGTSWEGGKRRIGRPNHWPRARPRWVAIQNTL